MDVGRVPSPPGATMGLSDTGFYSSFPEPQKSDKKCLSPEEENTFTTAKQKKLEAKKKSNEITFQLLFKLFLSVYAYNTLLLKWLQALNLFYENLSAKSIIKE